MKITDIFDFFSTHRKMRAASLLLLSGVFAALLCTLRFSEDIRDFLPLGTVEREEMSLYQNVSGAEKLYVVFTSPGDADVTVGAMDLFVDIATADDPGYGCDFASGGIDMAAISEAADFVYAQAPYFLTAADIDRMDSLLAVPAFVQQALARDREMLLFPASSLVSKTVSHDPLGLFSPVMERLQAGSSAGFALYGNYVFTPDMRRALLMLDSPFGSSETAQNARLLQYLEQVARRMQETCPDVAVDILGAPAIAVGNASRIKQDSFLAISLSLVLILLLLAYSFHGIWNILLVFLSVGWGLLFSLGGLALFRDHISIIVIGISSVILGIAVNYPLHLVTHTAHQPDRRAALREIVSPLVIGNITTVGAFLALVPLQAGALRDLGLFASLLLVGTILFVLLYLPHYVSVRPGRRQGGRLLDALAAFSPEKHRGIVVAAALLTVLLGIFSFRTQFDADMSHINYMTPQQRADMQLFEDLLARDDTHAAQGLYVYGKGRSYDEALSDLYGRQGRVDSLQRCGMLARQNELASFFVPEGEQRQRLCRWRDFVGRHRECLTAALQEEARKAGFSAQAFAAFSALLERTDTLSPRRFEAFAPLAQSIFSRSFASLPESGACYAVEAVNVAPADMESAKSAIGGRCFDLAGMNGAMTRGISDNFNYIGWACSLIVFFFLWFSFGRVELALISFLPMAVSWIWILGLMALLGIRFNIVNVILATFIFGQGDDYTIFMTEGCQYEHARKSPILASYKNSILQSAAIMFVGIGTLVVARHPALRSLAEVTIVGMFSVVLMACLIPPCLFGFLTAKQGRERLYPLTFRTLFCGAPKTPEEKVRSRYAYRGKDIERTVRRNLRKCAALPCPDAAGDSCVELFETGYGELALLAALSHPQRTVRTHIPDAEHRRIAMAAAAGLVDNIEFYK
ncbi:MAG: MMPL family transporter [Bacteroidales bacterium]|nr:MMPL family transporter [Bacteroidales bacterium]